MSRKGQLWRGELAQRLDEYLSGALPLEDLVDWALDHPFFEEMSDLDGTESSLIGSTLGMVLQRSSQEPEGSRTSDEQLSGAVKALWG